VSVSFGSPLPAHHLLSSRKLDLPSSSDPEPGPELIIPEPGLDSLENEEIEQQDMDGEDEQTVVIKKTSYEPLSPSSPSSGVGEPEPPSPARSSTNDTPSRKKIRVKVNNEVERIVVSCQCRLAHSTSNRRFFSSRKYGPRLVKSSCLGIHSRNLAINHLEQRKQCMFRTVTIIEMTNGFRLF
jgi:hypothetical protein